MLVRPNRLMTKSSNNANITSSSMAMDFITGSLDPKVTFSRASNATVIGSNGLIQYAPHNLLTFSEQFDNSAWSKTRATVTANATTAPNGTTTADKLVETVDTGSKIAAQSFTATAGFLYSMSVYAKADGRNFIQILLPSAVFGSDLYCGCNLLTGEVIAAAGATATATSVGNGWYRFTASATSTLSASGSFQVRLANSLSNTFNGYTGDGTSGAFIWGAQLEIGSTATTYNPTTVKNLLGFSEQFDNAAWTKSNSFIQTNLLTYSEQFDNAAWVYGANGVYTANTTISPIGSLTADTYTISGTTNGTYQNVTVSASTQYTFSFYVKLGTLSASNFLIAIYNNTASSFIVADIVPSQTPTTSEWTRITYSFTTPVGCTSVRVYPFRNASISAGTFFIWGAQLVQGSVAGNYQQTTSSALAVMYQDPNGTMTADKLVEDTATSSHSAVSSSSSFITGTIYTGSCYVKKGERRYVQLGGSFAVFGSTYWATFDLELASVGSKGSGTTASITDVGNGWYRCVVTAPATSTASGNLFIAPLSTNATTRLPSYTGDGTSGIYVWGAQLSDSASLDQYVNNPVAAPSSTAFYGARFDYDPVTLQPRGLLIEEQRSNLVLQSEVFNTTWTTTRASISSNVAVSPDGTADADKLVESTDASTHLVSQTASITSGTAYTFSAYVKAAERSALMLDFLTTGTITNFAYFNLATGAVGLTGGGVTATITNVGNGWYRCSISLTAASTITGVNRISLATGSTAGSNSYTGDGTSGLFIWGAQLEAGAFPTSYIPTTTAQVTRSADVALIQGSNFSSWYNPNAGTMYANAAPLAGVGNAAVFRIADSSAVTNYITLRQNASGTQLLGQSSSAGGGTAGLSLTNFTAGIAYKLAIAVQPSDTAVSINAGAVGTSTSMTSMPIVDRASIGVTGSWVIRQLAYYPTRLQNSQLQAITQ